MQPLPHKWFLVGGKSGMMYVRLHFRLHFRNTDGGEMAVGLFHYAGR